MARAHGRGTQCVARDKKRLSLFVVDALLGHVGELGGALGAGLDHFSAAETTEHALRHHQFLVFGDHVGARRFKRSEFARNNGAPLKHGL